MKKLLLIGLAMAILISGPALAAKDELRIYIWSEYTAGPGLDED